MERGLTEIAAELKAAGIADGATPDATMLAVVLLSGLRELATQVEMVAHGDSDGPGGLEALTVGVSGTGLRDSVTKAIRAHGDAIRALAAALTPAPKETP